jgi:HSP20 family protein
MALPVRQRQATTAQPVRRWEPISEFEQLQNQMGQLLESVLSTPGEGGSTATLLPLVDIEETDDAWIIEAELPGVDKDDVNVQLQDSELEITGDIKERERTGILRRRTRRTGRFEFRVTLPGQTDPAKVQANVRNGVLTVRIPKPEPASSRKIDVQDGNPEGQGNGAGQGS